MSANNDNKNIQSSKSLIEEEEILNNNEITSEKSILETLVETVGSIAHKATDIAINTAQAGIHKAEEVLSLIN